MFKRYYLIFFLIYFFCVPVYAGAWVQKKGEGLNITTLRRYISHQYWTPSASLMNSPTYAKNEVDEFVEYGVSNDLTLGAYFSALKSHTSAMGTQGGLNDAMLFGRYLFWQSGNKVASIQLSVDKLGHAASLNVPPQNSALNTQETLLLGMGDQFWFAGASLGLIQRYSAGNQIQINLEAGYKFNDNKIWLMLQNYNTISMDYPNNPQGVAYNLVTLSPSLVYWFTKVVGLQLGITQDIYGQNVGKGRGLFLSAWLRF